MEKETAARKKILICTLVQLIYIIIKCEVLVLQKQYKNSYERLIKRNSLVEYSLTLFLNIKVKYPTGKVIIRDSTPTNIITAVV